MTDRVSILFLCTGNSCRSQMAEAWVRALNDDNVRVASAGIETHGMNPYAVRAMAECGIDMSKHYSKSVDRLAHADFDYVVTVCGHANETCPVFPAKVRVIHHGFDDPPKLAEGLTDDDAIMDCYRRVRDQIRGFVDTLPARLAQA